MSILDAFDVLAQGKQISDDANYQWRVARHPVGNAVPDDFNWTVAAIPDLGAGEVLLRTHYLGLAPVMRMYMMGNSPSGETPLLPGDIIHGRGVAQIVKSRHSDWREAVVKAHCAEMIANLCAERDAIMLEIEAEQKPRFAQLKAWWAVQGGEAAKGARSLPLGGVKLGEQEHIRLHRLPQL
jgi:NADPH-dependent curcumin reductase CurA